MPSRRAADETPAAEASASDWYEYRPSVRLSPRDELRLLDEYLDEARARPRPPALAPWLAQPAAVGPRAIENLNGSAHAAAPAAAMNGHVRPQAAATPHAPVNGYVQPQPAASFNGPEPEPQAAGSGEATDEQQSAAEQDAPANGHNVESLTLLNLSQEGGADRKRLLAAIICILQEELIRSK